MINVCLTHDIDRIDKTYQYITKPLRAIICGDYSLFIKRVLSPLTNSHPYWGFDKIMEIENRYKVRSTCFFLNESARFELMKTNTWKLALGRYSIYDNRIINIIRQLDAEGWEIGVHGSYFSYNNYEKLKKEKQVLEEIVDHEIIGVRQHYLNLSKSTFEIHNKIGFKYDSTWGLTNGIGFRDGKISPFFPINGSNYCEIPLTIMDGPFAMTNDRWTEFEKIVGIIDQNDSFLVINYHNNNLDSLDFPSYYEDYNRMIETLIYYGANFYTMKQAYEQISNKVSI